MFKVAKLEKVENEKVNITMTSPEVEYFENGKKISSEIYNTLSFDITGDGYSFGFDLDCKLEKLLEIPMNETIDFKDYIYRGETFFNNQEPEMQITIHRYLKNKYIVSIFFYTDSIEDDQYSGIIEFNFNLDDYLKKSNKN